MTKTRVQIGWRSIVSVTALVSPLVHLCGCASAGGDNGLSADDLRRDAQAGCTSSSGGGDGGNSPSDSGGGGTTPSEAGAIRDAGIDAKTPAEAGAAGQACSDPFTVTDDSAGGRLHVENQTLRLEFGYAAASATHQNQSGGNLYVYVDKRYSATANVISVYGGGSGQTGAYASGAGGIGSTQLYAIDDVSKVNGGYGDAISDNDLDGVSLGAPETSTAADGSVVAVFRFGVQDRQATPVRWYEITKTWTIGCGGRIALRHDWKIVRTGYFSEPATREQVSTAWTTISRFGHKWDEPPSGKPGSDSRTNPANQWWDWTPDPSSVQQCNGDQTGLDAVHSDYVRFHGGLGYDFWFWPDNGGLGFEGLGLYAVGYQAFGQSSNTSVLEICHHNRTSIGDGADAYNVGPMAWWGGDGAGPSRYKMLNAGTTWTDTYQMEVRPTGETPPP